jgi:uncharacterized protein
MVGGYNRLNMAKNVLGGELVPCSMKPLTGWFRNGCCDTGPGDMGLHIICVEVSAPFLEFSRARGNDLSTPRLEYGFPGLHPGDRWCLCASRWVEALEADIAPAVILASTHMSALEFADLDDLKRHAIDEQVI